jgi:hypothetical protein
MEAKMIKRIFVALGIIFATGVAFVLFLTRPKPVDLPRLNRESRQYADQTIRAVVAHWSESELIARGSPELVEAAENRINLSGLFVRWSQLGELIEYDGAKGAAHVTNNRETGRIITAYYVAHARFAHGYAEITIGLVKRTGEWRAASFSVAPSLAPSAPRNLHAAGWRTEANYAPRLRTPGITFVAKRSIAAITSRCGMRPPGLNQQTS